MPAIVTNRFCPREDVIVGDDVGRGEQAVQQAVVGI